MKLTINAKQLAAALGTVNAGCVVKSPLAVLENVMLETVGNILRVQRSDIERTVTLDIPTEETAESGSVLVSGTRLTQLIKTLGDALVNISAENGQMTITTPTGKHKLTTTSTENWPKAPDASGMVVSIDSNAMIDVLALTSWATGSPNNLTRPVLNGVNISATSGHLYAVATDTRKLARCKFDCDGQEIPPITIPIASIGVISSILGCSETATLTIGEQNIMVNCGNGSVSSVLVNGKFPECERLIEQPAPNSLVVENRTLATALSRISALGDSTNKLIRLEINSGSLTVSSADPNYATSSEEVMKITSESENITLGINGDFLAESLKRMGANVKISWQDHTKAIHLTNAGGNALHILLMPMNL